MSSELSYEASDEASENELLERSLSVWKGWNSIEWEDFAPVALDIHTACSIGHYDCVRSIILKSEDPALDRRNLGGWTPLMYACYIGHDDIVNLLINSGCSMNMKNPRGHTPLMLAASCGNESVARTLVRRGAELELTDKTGWTALFHATYAGHQNFVAFLLEAGANKDAIEPGSGTTPLMEAAAEGHEIIVQLLLQHRVNVHAKAHNGDNARTLALMNGYMKIVSLIDSHVQSLSLLRSEPGLEFYLSSSDESQPRKHHPSARNLRLKSQGPSIRDGPEAIARMIDRTRNTDTVAYPNALVPKGYVSFPVCGADKEDTKLSYRDVTSPINPEDYKDSSGSRAMSDLDDFNDDSNAFTKTGAITIKSSSSSSGGLVAALGLSREGSLDSDDSHSYDQAAIFSDGIVTYAKDRDDGAEITKVASEMFVTDWEKARKHEYINPSVHRRKSLNMLADNNTMLHMIAGNKCFSTNDKTILNSDPCNAEIVSPLREYFPIDMAVPGRIATPSSSESQQTNGKSRPHHQELLMSPSSEMTLPKDNMTHAEIVNRFLKNLTINNAETSFGVCQNRWADEANNNGQSGIPDFSSHAAACCTGTSACEIVKIPPSSNSVDCTNVEFQGGNSVLGQDCDQVKLNLVANTAIKNISTQPAEAVGYVPEISDKGSISSEVQGQFFPLSNFNLHQKEMLEQLSDQLWTQYPQLNYHHPLHNRHHHHHLHNPHAIIPDSSGSTVNSAPRSNSAQPPSSQLVANQPDKLMPFLHNLSQEFFCQNTEASNQPHRATCGSSSSADVLVLASSVSHTELSATWAADPNPLSHIMCPVEDSKIMNLKQATATLSNTGTLQTVHAQSSLSNKAVNGVLPIAASAAQGSAVKQQHHLPPPQPQNAPPPLSPTATVIIPGHATSQPVCSSIAWDQVGLGQQGLGPRDLAEMLAQLGLTKYLETFTEQDVDLQVFLSMTDNDLKELGIKLFGPRKKMTNAIARWHSSAPIASNGLEQAYGDKLEAEMQEMAIRLNQAYENAEHLKAQVSQEQQLRSVTESCLMEERSSWEQARQILLSTRGKMRMMRDLMSSFKLHHKELKKLLEDLPRSSLAENMNQDSRQMDSKALEETDKLIGQSPHMTSGSSVMIGETEKTMGNSVSNISSVSTELFKKSEKCLKEMQQTLTSMVMSVEHLLKSTHNISSIDKDIT